jgi:hypothetical protein
VKGFLDEMTSFCNEVHFLHRWSTERQIEFYNLTRQLLAQIPDADVLDAVTVVHDYEQLAVENPGEFSYWEKLRKGITHLAKIIETKGKYAEAGRLRLLAPME